MINYEHLSSLSNQYDKHEVLKNIIRCKKSTNQRVVENAKLEIFMSMNGVIVKNIENFYVLVRGYKDIMHTRDDLVSEAFLTLDNCVDKFVLKKGTAFFWYYNKSLTWRMQRIIERQYYKHRNAERVEEGEEYRIKAHSISHVDFNEFYFEKFGITEEERRLIDSKMNREKIKDFIENNDDMTWNKYFKNLTSVKQKLKPLKDEDTNH